MKHKSLKWAVGIAIQGLLLCAPAWSATPNPNDTLVPDLVGYYPNLSCEALAAKSRFDGNGFKFLRTEIPWYWDQLKQNQKDLLSESVKEKFKNFLGFCAGDAHPENFAIQTNSAGQTVFGINDPDDANDNCPVLADFLRFLTAVRLSGKPADFNLLLQTYVSALTAEPGSSDNSFLPSDAKFLKNALKSTTPVDSDAPETPASGSGKSKAKCDDTGKRAGELAKILGIDPAEVESCKKEIKISGGSGGLTRYVLRYGVKSKNAKGEAVITEIKTEFKGTQAAGTSFYTNHDNSPVYRYQKACLVEAQKLNCRVVQIDSGDFLIRTKNDSDRAVSLGSLEGGELATVLHSEAVALARLHRDKMKPGMTHSSREQVASYAAAISSSSVRSELTHLTVEIAKRAQDSATYLKTLSAADFTSQCEAIRHPVAPTGGDTIRGRSTSGAARVH